MGGRARVARWVVAFLVLGVVAGACSSPSATGSSATTKAKGTLASTGTPVPSPGCSSPSPTSSHSSLTLQREDVTVDGVDRWYLLTTPSTRAGTKVEPVPLVVDLHGLAEGAALQADTSQFGAKADEDRFMVVFPEGTGSPVSWNIQPATSAHPNHDIDFMTSMLDSIGAHQCVDESRVYDTGFSDGALFTSLLACTMANRFAAFAPVAGAVMDKPCNPDRKVSIVAFHGTADPILHFNGGLGTAVLNNALGGKPTPATPLPPVNLNGKGYPANVKAWAVKDGCNPRATDTKVSAHVILRTYRCPPGTAIEFYIVEGGGHAWPGSKVSAALASITGPSTFEINATDIVWRFFQHHRLAR